MNEILRTYNNEKKVDGYKRRKEQQPHARKYSKKVYDFMIAAKERQEGKAGQEVSENAVASTLPSGSSCTNPGELLTDRV